MIPRLQRPKDRAVITLEVRERHQISPHFARVTLGGPEVRKLLVAGRDQTVRLFFPRAGQDTLRMPKRDGEAAWMAEVLMQPKAVRPYVRNLTIRAARPALDEIDIEFALHDGSPMTDWVNRVRPGDPAGIYDMGYTYLPPAPPDEVAWQLLVGDESAVPAIKSILDGAPADLTAEVFLEVPTVDDIQKPDPEWPKETRVRWISRDDAEMRPGTKVLRAVQRADLLPGRFYTWVAGEARMPATLRRYLVAEHGAAKSDITFAGYWRAGRASPG